MYINESPKLLDLSDPLDSNRIAYAPDLLLLPSCLLMHTIKCKGSLSPKRLPVSARRALSRKILDFKGLISFLEKAPSLCFCFFTRSCWTIPHTYIHFEDGQIQIVLFGFKSFWSSFSGLISIV